MKSAAVVLIIPIILVSGCRLFHESPSMSTPAYEQTESRKAPIDQFGLNAAFRGIMNDSGISEKELLGKWENMLLYLIEWSADSSLELFADMTESFGGEVSRYEYLPNFKYKAGLLQVVGGYELLEDSSVLVHHNALDKPEKYRIRIDADTMEWLTYDESVYNNMIYAKLVRRDSF